MNSCRDLWFSLISPSIQEVVVFEPSFSTPRMVIHMCLNIMSHNCWVMIASVNERKRTYSHSIMTPTPLAPIDSWMQSAICRVNRSWTWSRLAKCSTNNNLLILRNSFKTWPIRMYLFEQPCSGLRFSHLANIQQKLFHKMGPNDVHTSCRLWYLERWPFRRYLRWILLRSVFHRVIRCSLL